MQKPPVLFYSITEGLCHLAFCRLYFTGSISTGKLEGFNNKIKVAKRLAYGYRDNHFFFTLVRFLSIPFPIFREEPFFV
ncbi:MAG: transposase [Clostridia bacterium]|nr:transposase [Clostridia bacterium]